MDSFTLGARPEFEDREQGFAGMQDTYGLTNGVFTPVALDATYNALFEGDVDVANGFSTDAQLESGDEFMSVIEDVNKELTTKSMIEMNGAVDLDGKDPGDVARSFLRGNGP